MSREDLTADLLADLSPREEVSRPTIAEPAPLPPEPVDVTPTVSLAWTPLRWSRPRVVRASDGIGKGLRLGPLQVELSVRHD